VTQPQPEERDETGAEARACARCDHEEAEHEIIEADARSRVICRVCNDGHEFEPLPESG